MRIARCRSSAEPNKHDHDRTSLTPPTDPVRGRPRPSSRVKIEILWSAGSTPEPRCWHCPPSAARLRLRRRLSAQTCTANVGTSVRDQLPQFASAGSRRRLRFRSLSVWVCPSGHDQPAGKSVRKGSQRHTDMKALGQNPNVRQGRTMKTVLYAAGRTMKTVLYAASQRSIRQLRARKPRLAPPDSELMRWWRTKASRE